MRSDACRSGSPAELATARREPARVRRCSYTELLHTRTAAAAAFDPQPSNDEEHQIMSQIRVAIGAALIAATLAVSAQAQTNNAPSTTDKVKQWSQKKWNAAKVELQKNKEKWNTCNAKSTEQHLTGRKSWSFIYDCMKS
jgi:hypothetical protein